MKRTEMVVKTYGTYEELSDEQKERVVAMEANNDCRQEFFWNNFADEMIKNFEEGFHGTVLVVKVKNLDLEQGWIELSVDVVRMEDLLDYFDEPEGYRRLRILYDWTKYTLVLYGHESGADYYWTSRKPMSVFGNTIEFGPNGVMIQNKQDREYIRKNKDIIDFLREKTSELLEERREELFDTIKEQHDDFFSFEQIANEFIEQETEFLIEERIEGDGK